MGLFSNKTKDLAKELSKEVFEYSYVTVSKLKDLSQSSEKDYFYKKWKVVKDEDVHLKLTHEFQIFILYYLNWIANMILKEPKYKNFMDYIFNFTFKKTPNINKSIASRRYAEYVQYNPLPLDENLEFAAKDVENSGLGRFSYHLSKLLKEEINPILDGIYIISIVNQFMEERNIEGRLYKL